MNDQAETVTPLLGALLVSEGLLAPEQLAACLLLQQHDYAHMTLGEIVLRCGYVSSADLEQTLRLQHEMHDSLVVALEAHSPLPPDLDVLVLASHPSDVLTALIASMGGAVRYSRAAPADLAERRPDLILIERRNLQYCTDLLDSYLVELLPIEFGRHLSFDSVPTGVYKLMRRYVESARAERERREASKTISQRDFELGVLANITSAMATTSSAQDLLGYLMTMVRDLLLVEAATLFRVNEAAKVLVFEVVIGPGRRALTEKTLPLGQGIAGWVAEHGEPLLIPDVRHDRRFANTVDHTTGFQTHSMICVPMIAFGKTQGVLQLINKQDGEFSERDLQLVRVIAAFVALALAYKPAAQSSPVRLRERVLAACT